MTARLVELSLNSQLSDLLAVRACQYVLYDREPRRPAATGQRRTSRLLLLGTEMERPAANGAPECGNRGCRVPRRSAARRETRSSSPRT